jgi:bifunctional DNA primase/polymerase-like protein/AAA domain-containing protein/primase-like protein
MTSRKSPVKVLSEVIQVSEVWPVFPCNPLNKKPLTDHGFLDATRDRRQITRWWQQFNHAMIGVPTGLESNFWVLDVDVDDNGNRDALEWWRQRQAEHGEVTTRTHRTPRGGLHLLFKWDPDHPVRSTTSDDKSRSRLLPKNVDTRGQGGYVVVPPSRTSGDAEYVVERDVEVSDAPDWLYELAPRVRVGSDPKSQTQFSEPIEVRKLRAALAVISSDDYGTWYKIAAAVRRELNNETGWRLFREWSAKSSKFRESECRTKWDQASDISEISAGTIFYYATESDPTWLDRWEQEQAKIKQPIIKVVKLFPIDECVLPTRPWLVPGLLLRKALTLTAAPGGTGKSILTLCVAIMCALGIQWSDWKPRSRHRVLIINSEEDTDEQRRRAFAVAAKSMSVASNADLENWILTAENPHDIVVAEFNLRLRSMTRKPLVDQLISLIKQHQIDVVIVDPFAETFEGEETNAELKFVGVLWREVARQTNTAVWLVHHTRKYASEMAGDIDASRGGTALGNIARIGTTMFPMTRQEAELMGVPEVDRRQYVRFDDAKANYHMQSAKAQWFRSETCHLQNQHGDVPGDNVGVLLPWEVPVSTEGLDPETLKTLLQKIDDGIRDSKGVFTGEYYTLKQTQPSSSKEDFNRWVGILIRSELKFGDAQIQKLIKSMTSTNILVQFDYHSTRSRKLRKGCGTPALRDKFERVPDSQEELDV